MDQVVAVRQVCEKYLANRKVVFWTLMDLEKAMVRIDMVRDRCYELYRVWGKFLKAVLSFYVYCYTRVTV